MYLVKTRNLEDNYHFAPLQKRCKELNKDFRESLIIDFIQIFLPYLWKKKEKKS